LGHRKGSKEWIDIVNKVDLRTKRLPVSLELKEGTQEPFYVDYTAMGWPGNCGTPVRYVTPEEHREIERRLKSGRLTKSGSNVANVSQTLAEMMAEDIPQAPWIIEGLLREGGAMMIYGQSGIGKTWFVHTLMLLSSHGSNAGVWDAEGERWVLRAGEHEGLRVALVDGEMTRADIVERDRVLCGAISPSAGTGLRPTPGTVGLTPSGSIETMPPIDLEQLRLALKDTDPALKEAILTLPRKQGANEATRPQAGARCKRMVTEPTTPLNDGPFIDLSKIDVLAKSAQDPVAVFIDLSDPEWRQTIISYVKETETKVIIFHNLSTLCPSLEDENAAAEWSPLNDLVVSLKREGVATILVHHAGKGGSYRGSSNLVTTLETVVSLQAVESGEVACTDARFKVLVEKSRTGRFPLVNDRVLRLAGGAASGLGGKWVVEVDEHSTAERAVKLAKSLRFTTQKALGVALGLSPMQISRVIKVAVATGKAKSEELAGYFREAKKLQATLSEPFKDEETLAEALDI
jgi:AAA domain